MIYVENIEASPTTFNFVRYRFETGLERRADWGELKGIRDKEANSSPLLFTLGI